MTDALKVIQILWDVQIKRAWNNLYRLHIKRKEEVVFLSRPGEFEEPNLEKLIDGRRCEMTGEYNIGDYVP